MSTLSRRYSNTCTRHEPAGRLVLVSGEAGIGKTALVEAFGESVTDASWVAAACDGLFTPRALGPLFDIARELGGEMQAACRRGAASDELFSALLAELADAEPALVMVIEDLHWADEATLDLVRFVGRRIHTLPCLMIATYRDDAPTSDDALRILVGALASERGTRRIGLPTLSETAVAQSATGTHVTARELLRLSGCNPFFASEIVRSPKAMEDVVAAHAADLRTERKYDVRYLRYWVDEAKGKIFCLAEAPSAEAACTVHREAHGLVAEEVYCVQEGA